MTTLKRICIPRGKLVASLVIIAGMLTSCGGSKKRSSLYGNYPGISSASYGSGSGYGYDPNSLSSLSQSFPINNQSQASLGQATNQTSSNGELSSGNSPWSTTSNGGLLTFATAQDFGFLNSCYQQILTQGQGYFREGYTAESIFMGAGQEIVACYQRVLQQRTQWAQAQQQYQQQLYQWQYQQRMQQLYQYFASLNNNKVFEPARPPALPINQNKKQK